MIRQSIITNISLLRVGGAFTAVFSLVMGLFVLFVIPVACTFVGSLQLAILGLLFVLGALTFLIGVVLSRRKRKAGAEPGDAHE
jgi:membrane protein implicated in regulation of membrane protease activity